MNFLLHNHFITEIFFKKKSGDVNDEANFSFFILLQERAKPFTPPLHPSLNPPPYIHPLKPGAFYQHAEKRMSTCGPFS
jgi:hypothetical protein